ncbi:MAG: outer membrane lipoprotein-sorting protein [Bdellovibrionales bacterium]|nr:outer membrane lipoprotein-sorting protein [Bdellovibrionales bacterium]
MQRKASNSFYSKRLVWLHKDIKIPLKIEFFKGKRKEPIKRLEVKKLEQIEGVWTATNNIMSDLQNGSTTALIAEKIHYDNKIAKSFFTVRSLEEPSQDEKLRSRVR